MPTKQQHLSKSHIAEAAQRVLQADSNKHLDWIVITTFYCALHRIEAFFAAKNYPPHSHNTHKKREKAISKVAALDPIRQNYKNLSDASWKARYTKKNYNNDPAEVKDLIQIDLAAVVTRINGLINPAKT